MASVVDLHGETRGEGPDLVLLHPVGLDGTFWAPLAAAAAATHRVTALDLRGHGRSAMGDSRATIDDYVADIHAAMARRCRGPAVVLGLSFGGMLAQLVTLHHPAAVAALVACGCTGGFAPEVRPLLAERGLAAVRDGMASVVPATIERWFTPAFRADPRVEAVRARLLADDPASWSAAWHAISTFDALPRLAEVAVPALVIAGDADAATPIAAATRLAEAIPDAELRVLSGAPHMMQIECSAAFNAAVVAFLREARTVAPR